LKNGSKFVSFSSKIFIYDENHLHPGLWLATFIVHAQIAYSDKTAGFEVNIPEGWTHEKLTEGQLALRCTNAGGMASYDVNLKRLSDGQTAKSYLEYLESFMPEAGFSANFMPEQSRAITGDAAAAYNADGVYGGAYRKEKKTG